MVARAIGPDRQCRVGRHYRKRILPNHHLSLLREKKIWAEEFARSLVQQNEACFYPIGVCNLLQPLPHKNQTLVVSSFVCTGIHILLLIN